MKSCVVKGVAVEEIRIARSQADGQIQILFKGVVSIRAVRLKFPCTCPDLTTSTTAKPSKLSISSSHGAAACDKRS